VGGGELALDILEGGLEKVREGEGERGRGREGEREREMERELAFDISISEAMSVCSVDVRSCSIT
jgi:hypothetical protein